MSENKYFNQVPDKKKQSPPADRRKSTFTRRLAVLFLAGTFSLTGNAAVKAEDTTRALDLGALGGLGEILEEAGGMDTLLQILGLSDAAGSSSGSKKKSGSSSSKKKSGSSSSSSKKKSGSSSSSSKKKSGSSSSSSKKKSGSSTSSKKRFVVSLTKSEYIYNGELRKPTVKVTVGGKTVPKASYTVTYKNNKSVGRATVTVKGKGDYSGYTGERTFKITLKKTVVGTVSSPGAGQVKVTWTKDGQADGYTIQFCPDKEFTKGVKRGKVESGAKQTFLMEGLSSGQKYYVRIRSFKKVGSTDWYSEWSAAKQVTVQ